MTRDRWYWLAGVLLLAMTVGLLVVVVTGSERSRGIEGRVIFPAVWTPTNPDDDVPWRGAELRLEEDGSAQLTQVPGGEVQGSGGSACVLRSRALLTGPADWDVDSKGLLRIHHQDGSLILRPDQGKFGSVDWIDVSVPLCGESAATFGLRSALIGSYD